MKRAAPSRVPECASQQGEVEGRTGEDGSAIKVVPGGRTVVAQGEIEDEIDPDATTAVPIESFHRVI